MSTILASRPHDRYTERQADTTNARVHSRLHSCSYCKNVLLDASELSFNAETGGLEDGEKFELKYTLEDAVGAAHKGCALFASIIPEDRAEYEPYVSSARTTHIALKYGNWFHTGIQINQTLMSHLVDDNGISTISIRHFTLYRHPCTCHMLLPMSYTCRQLNHDSKGYTSVSEDGNAKPQCCVSFFTNQSTFLAHQLYAQPWSSM